MKNITIFSIKAIAALSLVAAIAYFGNETQYLEASSHREAPMIANDPLADNTDLYAFRSPDNPNTVLTGGVWANVELAFDESGGTPEKWADRQQALNDCVKALPEKSKQLLALKYDESFSIAAIATRMEQSGDAVVKALLRLRQALASCVEKKLKLQELGL